MNSNEVTKATLTSTSEFLLENYTCGQRVVVVECDMIGEKKYSVHCKINGGETLIWTRKLASLDKARKLAQMAAIDPHGSRKARV